MPLDLGQFLRNSIPVDRYDAVRTSAAEAGQGIEMGETGTLMGVAVATEVDPLAELMDSMEELTFQFEDKEMKKISDRHLGEVRGRTNPYIEALEGWLKTLPDMPGEEFTRRLLRMFREAQSTGQLPSPDELLQMLQEGSHDPSHQFAMIDILKRALANDETQIRSMLDEALDKLVETRGPQIRAGINLAEEVNARATTPQEMQELRDMYRGEVLGFSTPQDCFRSIMQTRGAAGLQAAIDFLTAGCGADLQSDSPSRMPEELRRIILDLQCVQVLKTVLDKMTGLSGRMEKQFGEPCLLNGEKLTGRVMDFTERSSVVASEIGEFISECGLTKLLARMDFCRELTWVFRQLSPRMFYSEKDRLQLVDAAQEHLDGIVEEEYEGEEDEGSGSRGGDSEA